MKRLFNNLFGGDSCDNIPLLIINGSIKPIKYDDYTYKIVPKPDENVDDSRELKDICTEIVVNVFMQSSDSNFNFLKEVYSLFSESINCYIAKKGLKNNSIIFVYKGGNILRFVANEFLRELPGTAANDIQAYYKQFFKRSDSDFSIYVDPLLEDYDKVFNDMVQLSYHLQVKLREIFNTDKIKYFDYYRYNDKYMEKVLTPYIDKLKKASVFTDPNNKTYYGKTVTDVFFDPPNIGRYIGKRDAGIQNVTDNILATFDITNESNNMYVQLNDTLDFISGERIKFSLVRTKIDFNIILSNSELVHTGGELIDVSLPHKLDAKLNHFFQNLQRYTHSYEMKNNEGDVLKFISYSIEYLAEDLEYILFMQSEGKPWVDRKYEKRVNRLLYMYMIDIFNKVKTNSARKNVIEELKAITETPTKQIRYDLFQYIMLNNLIGRITTMSKTLGSEDQQNFTDFLKVVNRNATMILNSFQNVSDYCSVDGSIKLKEIYDGTLASIV